MQSHTSHLVNKREKGRSMRIRWLRFAHQQEYCSGIYEGCVYMSFVADLVALVFLLVQWHVYQ